jgi:shikimate dehydrogenase
VSTPPHLRVGVIGDPVAHSISPAMHQPALDAMGINATYERWHTPLGELKVRIESLRDPHVLGSNVTVPHKMAVMQFIDEISEIGRRAGAVNTIVNRGGRLSGDNTDVYGFATSLVDAVPDAGDRAALILGAGGAARAVALALDQVGSRRIMIHNRNQERARQLGADLAPLSLELIGDDCLPEAIGSARIVVNATALGWRSGETPIAVQLLSQSPQDALIADLTYRDTDLLLAARSRGLATLDGLPMLVHQGARALELWTGRTAPVEIMMRAALAARTGRA